MVGGQCPPYRPTPVVRHRLSFLRKQESRIETVDSAFLLRHVRDLLGAEHLVVDANIINQAREEGPLAAFIYSSSSGASGIFSFSQ